MRALIAVIPVFGVAISGAWASPPTSYTCDRPDEAHEKCDCAPGQHNDRDRRNQAICVPDAPERCEPLLFAPVSGADVDATVVFVVEAVPGLVDVIRVEVCADAGCARKPLQAKEAAPVSGEANIEITDLPRGSTLYWRAMCRKKGELLDTHSAISSFKVVAAKPTPVPSAPVPSAPVPHAPVFDLQRIDAAIAVNLIDAAVKVAGLSTKVADHLEVARRLAKAGHCADIERVLGLPADPNPDLDEQAAQLRADCIPVPPLSDSSDSSDSYPKNRSKGDFDGMYARALYRMPLAGARTGQGMGYQIAGNFRAEKDADFGPMLVVIQPLADGPDGRTGNLWEAGLHFSGTFGSDRFAFGLVFEEVFGGGRFPAADNRHGLATFDSCLGPSARLNLGAGFGLRVEAMGCGGVMFDVSHFLDSNNPEQGRWHGTTALDLGLTLDWTR